MYMSSVLFVKRPGSGLSSVKSKYPGGHPLRFSIVDLVRDFFEAGTKIGS
jgi:hypothetical protein